MKTKEFIERAKIKHGDRFSYEKSSYLAAKAPITIICPVHGDFTTTPTCHLNQAAGGCVRGCVSPEIHAAFMARASLKHGSRFTYPHTQYSGNTKDIEVVCGKHGAFTTTPAKHCGYENGGCPKCYTNKLSKKEFIARAKSRFGDKYELDLTCYKTTASTISAVCKEHGLFTQAASSFLSQNGCPKCAMTLAGKNHRIPFDTLVKRAKEKHGNEYEYEPCAYDAKSKGVLIICKKHGKFSQEINSHLAGCGCPTCYGSFTKTTNDFISESETKHKGRYSYDNASYSSNAEPLTITCRTHGDFEQVANNHRKGHGCPSCASKPSKGEYDLAGYLRGLSVRVVQSDYTLAYPKEIDVYLPDNNIAIEYNGLYWHSHSKIKEAKYHLNKTLSCEENGVKLFHIFEDEWLQERTRDIWKSMISAKLGKAKRIYARKCSVLELTKQEARRFTNENHLQGASNASIAYGLYHDGRIVACMTFNKARYTQASWEILRMCNVQGVVVVGGFSKLLKAFTRKHDGSIISYANRRFSQGDVYKACGFTLLHASDPCYYYVIDGVRKHRSGYMKHLLSKKIKVFDKSKSEYENMKYNGYDKIYDCGNLVYLFDGGK